MEVIFMKKVEGIKDYVIICISFYPPLLMRDRAEWLISFSPALSPKEF
jgi:hypothetical protein